MLRSITRYSNLNFQKKICPDNYAILSKALFISDFVYMLARVTLGRRSPYQLGRVILLEGLTSYHHVNSPGRVTLLTGLSFPLSNKCRVRAIYEHGFAWLCLLVEVALWTTLHM